MFEVITQSQPQDYQSLEILREAYIKLGRKEDIVRTSKRLAEAYVSIGQLSSAILEYESVLQHIPDDPGVTKTLKELEAKAAPAPAPAPVQGGTNFFKAPVNGNGGGNGNGGTARFQKPAALPPLPSDMEDGRRTMHKIFVDGKLISEGDFELCWPRVDLSTPPGEVSEPFIQVLQDKGILPLEKSLKIICDKSRFAYLQLNLYDVDIDLARSFPAATCRRWCVVPFDRMSKSTLVATANPFNQQAGKELAAASANRLLWYLVPPTELVKLVRKAFR
jgi:hypothetical protein